MSERELDGDETIQTRGDQGGDDEQYSVGAEGQGPVKGLRDVVRMESEAGAAVQELAGLFGGTMRGLLAEGACQDQSAK